MKTKRIAIVQPVLAPYAKQRFEELAKDDSLEIVLLIERKSFRHRPGWNITEVKGCKVEIIDSYIKRVKIENVDQGYLIEGVRAIPYRLPFLIAKYKPDVVLVCNATELSLSYVLKYVLNYKIGLIVEDTVYAVKNIGKIKQKLKSSVYKRADFFLSFSKDAVDYLRHIGVKKNIFRTSWSIDLRSFDCFSRREKARIRRILNLGNKLVFITVAQLIPLKGIMNLLSAWNDLTQEIKSMLSLIIIGEGPQRTEIENFINFNRIPNIHLLGQKSYSALAAFYHAADVCVFPTLQDVFGIVVMEAMASGLPVAVSTYCSVRELVAVGRNGYIFDSANIDEIKEVIVKIYAQRHKLKRMGKASYEIIKNYTHDRVMRQLKGILLSV